MGAYGLTVRKMRQPFSLSLRELARRVKVAPSYLSDIENGRRLPSLDVSDRIAEQIGFLPDNLWWLALSERLSERDIAAIRRFGSTLQDSLSDTEG